MTLSPTLQQFPCSYQWFFIENFNFRTPLSVACPCINWVEKHPHILFLLLVQKWMSLSGKNQKHLTSNSHLYFKYFTWKVKLIIFYYSNFWKLLSTISVWSSCYQKDIGAQFTHLHTPSWTFFQLPWVPIIHLTWKTSKFGCPHFLSIIINQTLILNFADDLELYYMS